ncbi:hypothetical protein PIB30_033299 [Stylosanthes scabra]|uniref:Uncharacterized protein n=1 Tax=Stylosanthes scabra TaxID=79078 RepID=A0ABU6SCZ2_9FABA|nr:hypothetical protein [Stylosanthes scabra]
MSRRGQSSETRSRTIGEYSVGGDNRTYTLSSDSMGQPRKKKFSSRNVIVVAMPSSSNHAQSLIRIDSSWTIQPHSKYFYWLDVLVEKNIEEVGCGKNGIFMARKMKELEQRVMELNLMELNLELNLRVKNDVRGVHDNKCLHAVIVGGLKPGVGMNVNGCGSFGLAGFVVGCLTIGCFIRNLAGGG